MSSGNDQQKGEKIWPQHLNLEPEEWDAETPPSIFLSKGEAISLRRSNGENPVSSKENMFYNASASSLNKLQNKLNISLHSLELLQKSHRRQGDTV